MNSEPEQELASPAEDRKGEGRSESREASPDWGEPIDDLDEALSDLVPRDPGGRVDESAAPVNLVPPGIPSATATMNAAAHAAYNTIREFRKVVIHDRVQCCIDWLKIEMCDFHILAVEFFGSKCYNLELVTSDVDLVVILGPGQNPKRWLEQVQMRSASFPAFVSPRWQPRDTFQTTHLGVPVDIKPIKNTRTIDGACRSTDCLKLSGCESRDL